MAPNEQEEQVRRSDRVLIFPRYGSSTSKLTSRARLEHSSLRFPCVEVSFTNEDHLHSSSDEYYFIKNSMSDLFTTQNQVTQDDCDAIARRVTSSSLTPVPWQGYHSYTLLAASRVIVQFRSKTSPLNVSTAKLAKAIHGHLAPTTNYHGFVPGSSITIWVMEVLPGVGYLFTISSLTQAKQDAVIADFAK